MKYLLIILLSFTWATKSVTGSNLHDAPAFLQFLGFREITIEGYIILIALVVFILILVRSDYIENKRKKEKGKKSTDKIVKEDYSEIINETLKPLENIVESIKDKDK